MRKPFLWAERKGWYLRVPAEGGKFRTVRLADSKKAAYDRWDRMKASAGSGEVKDGTLVVDVVRNYLADQKEQVKLKQIGKNTVERRMERLLPFAEYLAIAGLSKLSIADLKPHHVQSWLTTRDTWNATTRHHAAEAVKQATKWACDQGYTSTNPIATLRISKGASRDHTINRDEYSRLLAGVRESKYTTKAALPFRLYLMGLWHSGCRPSEMASLSIEDFAGDTWTVKRHKNRRKKKQRPRIVYLSPCLQTISRIAAAGRTRGPLFAKYDGSPWQYSDLRRRFERLRKKVNADPKCVLYSFRHTWITNALMAGVDIAATAEMAGTSIRMIDEHYGHLARHRDHMIAAALLAGKWRVGC